MEVDVKAAETSASSSVLGAGSAWWLLHAFKLGLKCLADFDLPVVFFLKSLILLACVLPLLLNSLLPGPIDRLEFFNTLLLGFELGV